MVIPVLLHVYLAGIVREREKERERERERDRQTDRHRELTVVTEGQIKRFHPISDKI